MIIISCTNKKGDQNITGTESINVEQLLQKAKANEVQFTFYSHKYNKDNTFSLVNMNGSYNLILPLKDCFLDIKCSPTCDTTIKTGHTGDHLWYYLMKNDIKYTLDPNDWNTTIISVVEGLLAKGIPVSFKTSISE
jgi:hypothetical protein